MSLISRVKHIAHTILVRTFPKKMGYEIRPVGKGYFDAKTIVRKAKAENLSVTDYLEKYDVGGVGRKRDDIIKILQEKHVLNHCNSVLEMGAGTGMFVEKFIEIVKPSSYEIYETSIGWRRYLSNRYFSHSSVHVKVHEADGCSLSQTESSSIELVTAHGVFVYLPIVITFQYLKEAVRICRPGGLIVFDCFTDKVFTAAEIIRFREINPHYDFPVVIPEHILTSFCADFHIEIVTSFNVPYHSTNSTYFIFRKM